MPEKSSSFLNELFEEILETDMTCHNPRDLFPVSISLDKSKPGKSFYFPAPAPPPPSPLSPIFPSPHSGHLLMHSDPFRSTPLTNHSAPHHGSILKSGSLCFKRMPVARMSEGRPGPHLRPTKLNPLPIPPHVPTNQGSKVHRTSAPYYTLGGFTRHNP